MRFGGSTAEKQAKMPKNHMDKVCHICGHAGFAASIKTCSLCKVSSEHMYCMRIVLLEVPEEWHCEECSQTAEAVGNRQASVEHDETVRAIGDHSMADRLVRRARRRCAHAPHREPQQADAAPPPDHRGIALDEMASAGAGDEPPRRSISSLFRATKALSRRCSTTPTATPTSDSQPARELTNQQIPDEPSPGTVESATVESTRAYIEPEGNTFNPHTQATHKITSLIRSSFESPYLNWKAIPIEVRDMWFREFERSFHWLPQYNARIKRNFEKAGSKRMRDMFTHIRAADEQPDWIGDRVWAELGKKWMSPEYVAMCAQNKKNRASDCGGMGTSKSTCGSRPLTQHRRHITAELGREPTLPELHTRTHTKKGTQDWIDNRSQAVHDNYLRLKEQHSQPNVGDGSFGASSQVPSDFSLWTQAAGGKNRGRTYGLGSQGPAIDAQDFYASPSDFSGRTTFDFQQQMAAMQAQHQQEMAAMQAQYNKAMKKQQEDLFRQMEERMAQRFGQPPQ